MDAFENIIGYETIKDELRELIDAKSYDKADEVLATMDSLTEFKDELSDLKRLNSLARNMGIRSTYFVVAVSLGLTSQIVPIPSSRTSTWRCKAARYRGSDMPTLYKHPTLRGG